MQIKALATEMERVLTGPDQLLDLDAVEALRSLTEAGLPVVFVTLQDCTLMQSLTTFLGSSRVIAAENGRVIQDYRTHQPPRTLCDLDQVSQGMQILRDKYGDHLKLRPGPERLCSLALQAKQGLIIEEANAALAEAALQARLFEYGKTWLLEDMRVDKVDGLAVAAEILGLEMDEFAVLGENPTDLGMLQAAGYRIALRNAHASVIEQASFVANNTYGRGFCEAAAHILDFIEKENQVHLDAPDR
jgi:hydroxymethylpyrimidine pyrophosphatase-like HAD family hydrolase